MLNNYRVVGDNAWMLDLEKTFTHEPEQAKMMADSPLGKLMYYYQCALDDVEGVDKLKETGEKVDLPVEGLEGEWQPALLAEAPG